MCRLLVLLLLFSLYAEEKITPRSDYTVTIDSGDVGYIAYTKPGANRPLTFVFNGGPGSSSVWLHLGAFGPRRVLSPEEGQKPTPPYQLIDNDDSILDLTDLVFIDPKGTGLTSAADDADKQKFYSIRGDIQSIATFIRDYLTRKQRWNSPKYLAGESYGALRAAGLAQTLQSEMGIYLNGILFISPAIDYQPLVFLPDNLTPYYLFLPTYATTAWYHKKGLSHLTLKEVAQKGRDFAYDFYAPALLCRKCPHAIDLWEEMASLTGLPLSLIQKKRGLISDSLFFKELLSSEQQLVGRFDGRYIGDNTLSIDPSSSSIEGLFAGAFHDYLHRELEVPHSYTLISEEVNEKWQYYEPHDWGFPNLMTALRAALVSNPHLKLFFGCGYFDLATPFAATEYLVDHLEVPYTSVQMGYYEGGHMFYLNPAALHQFKQDLISFFKEEEKELRHIRDIPEWGFPKQRTAWQFLR